ncbi:MAG TPA: ABC transporter permease subunit [Gemmataceae bacterium]|jgi:hypothetical protein|nr:ABC transporter permease subunit [Gemmataceae bacterium]
MATSRHLFVLLPEAAPWTLSNVSFYQALWLSLLKLSGGYSLVTLSCWLLGIYLLRGLRVKVPLAPLLRAAKQDQSNKAIPKMAWTARKDLRSLERQMPQVGDNALLWKEKYQGIAWVSCARILWPATLPFIFLSWIAVVAAVNASENMITVLLDVQPLARILVNVLFACLCLGVAMRSAASVALERQQQTLDTLLVLPVERREILRAKWLGCLWRGAGWYPLLASVLLFGVCTGGSMAIWCLASTVFGTLHVMFFNSLGSYFSVISATAIAARFKVMVVILVLGVNPVGFWNFNDFEHGDYDRYAMNESIYLVQNTWVAALAFSLYVLANLLFLQLARRRFEQRQT